MKVQVTQELRDFGGGLHLLSLPLNTDHTVGYA